MRCSLWNISPEFFVGKPQSDWPEEGGGWIVPKQNNKTLRIEIEPMTRNSIKDSHAGYR